MAYKQLIPISHEFRRILIKSIILLVVLVFGYYITFVVLRRTTSEPLPVTHMPVEQ